MLKNEGEGFLFRAVQKSVRTGNPDQIRPNRTVWFGSIKNWFEFGLRNMRTV